MAAVKHLQLTALQGSRGHKLKWRGVGHALQFAEAVLELTEGGQSLRWRATVGFTDAGLRYPILGARGLFEFLNVAFRHGDGLFEISPGARFPAVQAP